MNEKPTLAKALRDLVEREGKIMVPVLVANATPDNSDDGLSVVVGDQEFVIGASPVFPGIELVTPRTAPPPDDGQQLPQESCRP